MFDDKDYIKQKLQEFLNDEFEEIKQNKIRFFALIFSLLISLALLFSGDSAEKIEVGNSETVQVEENSDAVPDKNIEKDKKSSNNRVIHVKKDSEQVKGEKVVAVIGANSDKLYVGDPFQSEEEKTPAEIPPQTTQVEITPSQVVIPQQIPIIPPQPATIPVQISDLPPIPSVTPTIPETLKYPEKELILTGTAINSGQKAAIIKKISTVQGKDQREENLILGVGDSVEGHKIIDITSDDVIFDDGYEVTANYLSGGSISISAEEENVETSDIPANYTENPVNSVSIPEYALPEPIPDLVNDYDEILTEKNSSEINNIESPDNVVSLENKKDYIEIDDDNFGLNASEKLTEFETDTININDSFGSDAENSTIAPTDSEVSVSAQGYAFVASDSSP